MDISVGAEEKNEVDIPMIFMGHILSQKQIKAFA